MIEEEARKVDKDAALGCAFIFLTIVTIIGCAIL